uniref:Vascular cell adhesion protein 1-like n=1 Tax=Gadus morhua TaxID=8049 RepID=A0A8C5BB36_GADMO
MEDLHCIRLLSIVFTLELLSISNTMSRSSANSQCPITITPERLVMPYGNQTSVLCKNSNEDASRNVIALNWRVDHQIVTGPRLFLDKVLVWDPRAECIGTFSGIGKCSKPFDVTFYKTADSVSIHSINHTGPMLADEEYQLQCDIVNVAPVQNLTVRWYQGDDLLKDKGSLRVTGCPHQNKVECDNQVIRSPVNVSSTIKVRLGRNPDGAQFRCEAQLALEEQPPPPTNSNVLSLSVHYEPIINSTKLPLRLQVFKGHPTELVCEADGRPAPNIHWVSAKGVRVSGGNLTVTEAGVWTCNATNVVGYISRAVEVTVLVKETADQVLIHPLGHTGPMLADKEYKLQCDIVNVAPVQNLTVRWYQGDDLLKDQGSLRVTGCPHQNKVECDIKGIRSPVNVSSTITVRLGRNQDGAQFRCEAQLALEQQPPPPMMFHRLNLSVHYRPIINKKPESKVPVFKGYPVDLVCEADGRPVADIHWYSAKGVHVSGGNLTATEAGVWTCNATNVVGYSLEEVEVVMKEDYLPLIAGFVAATVLIISAVFIFFYSIYYKNTKMRRYSLKNPKPSVLNGNVAHNSWDSQLPMTKLP